MKKLIAFLFIASAIYGAPQTLKRGRDVAHVTDVSAPQPDYQVITSEQVERIYTQKQAIDDIKDRLTSIEGSITEIKGDVKVLTETNAVLNFVLGALKIFIPGIFLAWFGIWYSNHLKNQKPRKQPA